MDVEKVIQRQEEPEINYHVSECDWEKAKPEFIVCANDDNFEIAFDPLATNDDDVHQFPQFENVHRNSKMSTDSVPKISFLEHSNDHSANDHFQGNEGKLDAVSNVENIDGTIRKVETNKNAGINDNDRFECFDCGKAFKFLSLLKGHSRKHTVQSSTKTVISCRVCHKKFRRKNNLRLHMAAVHPIGNNGEMMSSPPPKQCEICHKQFYHNGNFKTHMKIHGGIRAHPCTICDKTFVLAQHLKSHMRLVHSDEKSIQCPICGKLFNHPGNYKKHMRIHSGERPFKCLVCEKSFAQSSNYTAHMRVHDNVKPYKCIECNRTFIQAINLTHHMRIHSSEPEQQLKCDVCDKTFMRLNYLRLHEKKHQRTMMMKETENAMQSQRDDCKPQLCSICGKSLVGGRRSLRMHMKIHDDDRAHGCLYCDKKFITKNDCSKHMRIHTGEKPYTCELCAKCFRHSASYRIHMRNHNGEKPYRCTHCDKGFSASSDCKKHIKSHENGRLATMTTTTTTTVHLVSDETENVYLKLIN